MKNMKKVLVIALSLVLVSVLSVASTLAYLNSEKSAVNVMTAGNVQIQLNEQQRNEKRNALEDFEQGKVLTPLVGSAQGEKDGFGMPVSKNYQDKIISVTNTGASAAYVRVLVATPASVTNLTDALGPLHYNYGNRVDLTGEGRYNTGEGWKTEWKWNTSSVASVQIEIGGVKYNVDCFTYEVALPAGEQTSAAVAGFYLDSMVDYDAEKGVYTFNGVEIEGFNGAVAIPVIAQATQVDGFESATAAFAEAFPYGDNNEDLIAWFEATGLVDAQPAPAAERPAGFDPVIEGTNVVDGLTVVDNSDEKTNLRALYTRDSNVQGDFTVKNSYLDGTYAMNVIGDDNGKLTVVDTDLRGWVSYDGFTSATFTNVTFGRNTNPEYYNTIRPYSTITFENCEFDGTDFWLDKLPADAVVTFKNSTMNGALITSENDITINQPITVGAKIVVANN